MVTLPAVLGGILHHWGGSDQLPVLWFIPNSPIKQGWTFVGAAEPVLLRAEGFLLPGGSRCGSGSARLRGRMRGEGLQEQRDVRLLPGRCSHRNNFGFEV